MGAFHGVMIPTTPTVGKQLNTLPPIVNERLRTDPDRSHAQTTSPSTQEMARGQR
jgi:hypothetical protein